MTSRVNLWVNSLDLFRLLAAIQVMWGHSIYHLSISGNEYIGRFLDIFLGVPTFFFLSGFLIWISLKRGITQKQYFLNRFLRIYPELWICVFVELISIIALYPNINWLKLSIFAFTQASVFQFWTPDFLRGYGCGTPNGALWTISVTVQFYVLIWIGRKFLINRSVEFWGGTFIVFLVVGIVSAKSANVIPALAYKLLSVSIVPYGWLFFGGMVIAELGDEFITYLRKNWYVFFLVVVALRAFDIDISARYPIALCVCTFLMIIGLAYRFPSVRPSIDISYAFFIYHMIFVNVVIELGGKGSLWGLAVTIMGTGLISYASTRVVGTWIKKVRK